MKGVNNEWMAHYNRFILLKLFYQNGSLGIQQAAKMSGLTTAAASKIIKKLSADGFIVHTQESVPLHGKHRGFWAINNHYQSFLCIEITSKQIISCVVDFIGSPLGDIRLKNCTFTSENEVLQILLSECTFWQQKIPNLKYAGLSVTGIVDNKMRHSRFRALMQTKDDIDFISLLEPKTGLKFKINNNCNNMLLAEKWLGKKLGSLDSCFLFHLDYGIGGAFLKRQEIFVGSQHTAVQIGHIPIDTMGPPCPCGSRGCVEVYANEDNLIKGTGYKTIGEFYQALNQKAAPALEKYNGALYYIGVAIGIVVNLYEPDKIILTGSFTEGNCLEDLKAISKNFSISALYENCEIVQSTLTAEQFLAGCAFLWIEELLSPA